MIRLLSIIMTGTNILIVGNFVIKNWKIIISLEKSVESDGNCVFSLA